MFYLDNAAYRQTKLVSQVRITLIITFIRAHQMVVQLLTAVQLTAVADQFQLTRGHAEILEIIRIRARNDSIWSYF
jgi:hypothetical protein